VFILYIGFHIKYQLFLSECNENSNFLQISKHTQIPNSMKVRPVGIELFHADGRTDGHYKANSRFSLFFQRA
jgi:hypothetical protein